MTYSLQLAQQYGFGTGDRIIVPKSAWNMVQHHALFYGIGQNGHALVAENKEGRGVILTRLDVFLADAGRITRIIPFSGSYQQRVAVLDRVNARLGRWYDTWKYNCEHFVNEVLHFRTESRQADIGKALLGGAAVVAGIYGLVKLLSK
ncbi:MAG: hypothetical protein IPK70_00060 [Flavobacteriales bacterium]|nr:hypothetical protein [Flavobacteriales bacterium]MBK8225549.1 hypothetical protein [Flavobacteriales bacterium]